MAHIIEKDELPHSGTAHRFEGYLHGEMDVSFFLSDTAPGKGPDLHKHPYDEACAYYVDEKSAKTRV